MGGPGIRVGVRGGGDGGGCEMISLQTALNGRPGA